MQQFTVAWLPGFRRLYILVSLYLKCMRPTQCNRLGSRVSAGNVWKSKLSICAYAANLSMRIRPNHSVASLAGCVARDSGVLALRGQGSRQGGGSLRSLRGSADKEIHVTTRDVESRAASMSIVHSLWRHSGNHGRSRQRGRARAPGQAACDGSVMNGQR